MSQRNLNGYRWPRNDWQSLHGGRSERQNFYWHQRNDAALGDDRYVNSTDREDISGSWDFSAFDDERRSFRGVAPKNFKRTDESLLEEVNELLTHAPDLDASEIETYVNHGVVTLRGEVPNRRMKRLAETYVDRVQGVLDVMNELTPRPSEPDLDRAPRH